jgi:hypothetical protein
MRTGKSVSRVNGAFSLFLSAISDKGLYIAGSSPSLYASIPVVLAESSSLPGWEFHAMVAGSMSAENRRDLLPMKECAVAMKVNAGTITPLQF